MSKGIDEEMNMSKQEGYFPRAIFLCVFFLCAVALVAPGGPQQRKNTRPDSLGFENEYVRVVRDTASAGKAHSPGVGTRVVVALAKTTVQSKRGKVELERGQVAAFTADEWYEVPAGSFFEVAFKLEHPPVLGPEQWIEPTGNATVYEDAQIRVFEERLEGGGERPLHSHAQRVVVRLNEVQLTDPRVHATGRPGSGIQVPNTVRFAEPVVHVVRNLSTIPLFNIVIEFKRIPL